MKLFIDHVSSICNEKFEIENMNEMENAVFVDFEGF